MNLEKGKMYDVFVKDYFGTYETKARFLGIGNKCREKCHMFAYAVAKSED